MKKRNRFSLIGLKLSLVIVVILLFAGESLAQKWNFTSSLEGWTGRNNCFIKYASDGNGRLYMYPEGSDPGIVSANLYLNASTNNLIRMYIWTYCPDKDCRLYFKRSGSSSVYTGGYVYLRGGSSGGTYEIDMSGNSNWYGTITQIRIDPSDSCGSPGNGGFIGFDWIETVAAPAPDLIVRNQNANPTTVEAGSTIYISCTVKNQGSGSSGSSYIKYYLSGNSTYDTSDAYLGSDYVSSLSSGATSSESATVTIPSGTSAGTEYILFYADKDAAVSESNEWNNVSYKQISVSIPVPDAPDLYSPNNYSIRLNQTPHSFDWSTETNASKYRIYVDNHSGFGSPEINPNLAEMPTSSNLTSDTSLSNNVYYWKVQAINSASQAGSWSSTRQFIVDTPPPAPALGLPSGGSEYSQGDTATFSWSGPSGYDINRYYLRIVKGTDLNTTPAYQDDTITSTSRSATFAGWSPGTYTWAVRAIKDTPPGYNQTTYETTISWGQYATRTFTIKEPPPAPPVLQSPSDFSIFKKPTSITFQWASVSGAVEYSLEIDNNFNTPENYHSYSVPAPTTSKTISSPDWSNDVYHWRVRAKNSEGLWGDPQTTYRQFVYDFPPDAPVFSNPQPDDEITIGDTITFSWSAPCDHIHRYWFRIVRGADVNGETVADYPAIVSPSTSQQMQFTDPKWTAGTYTCWVKAIKETPSGFNQTTYETTISWGNPASMQFTLVNPVPGIPQNVNAVQIFNGIRITWDAVSGVSGVVPYKIYWGNDDSVSEDNRAGVLKTDQTVYEHTNLDAGIPYYYKVKACNDSGCSLLSTLKSAQAPSADLNISVDAIPSNVQQGGTASINCTVGRTGGLLRPVDGFVRIYVYMNQDQSSFTEQDLILEEAGDASFDVANNILDDGIETASKNITIPSDVEGPFYIHVKVDGPGYWAESNEANNTASSNTTMVVWRPGTPPEEEMGVVAREWDKQNLYWIKYGKKWPFINQETFFNLGYSDAIVQWYGASVLDGFTTGKTILQDDGSFVYRKQSVSTVYIVRNGKSDWFFNWDTFANSEFGTEDVYWATDAGFDWIQSVYPPGELIGLQPRIRVEPTLLKFE